MPQQPTQFDPNEHSWPKDARESGIQWPKNIRKEYYKHMMKTIGPYNMSQREMCAMTGSSRRRYYGDMEEIRKEGVTHAEMAEIKTNLFNTLLMTQRKLQTLLAVNEDARETAVLASTSMQAVKETTDYLERWEVKKPGPETKAGKITIVWGKPQEENHVQTTDNDKPDAGNGSKAKMGGSEPHTGTDKGTDQPDPGNNG